MKQNDLIEIVPFQYEHEIICLRNKNIYIYEPLKL